MPYYGDFFRIAIHSLICDIIIKALRNYCTTRGQMYFEKTQKQACLTYIKVKYRSDAMAACFRCNGV